MEKEIQEISEFLGVSPNVLKEKGEKFVQGLYEILNILEEYMAELQGSEPAEAPQGEIQGATLPEPTDNDQFMPS